MFLKESRFIIPVFLASWLSESRAKQPQRERHSPVDISGGGGGGNETKNPSVRKVIKPLSNFKSRALFVFSSLCCVVLLRVIIRPIITRAAYRRDATIYSRPLPPCSIIIIMRGFFSARQ